MPGSFIPMTYMVGVQGAAAAIGQVQGLTGALRQSQSAIGIAPNMSRWMQPIAGVRTALSGIGRMAAGVFGGLGMAGGLMGLTKLVRESSDFNSAMISLQATLGESDSRMAIFKTRMEELAKVTGRGRTELVAAARAGMDYGLSLDEVSSQLGDLDALARVMNVAPEMLMGGVGGLHKLAGEGVDQGTLRTMLFEGQQASGMREEPFLELVRRAAPQFAGDKRFEGQEGTALFLANVASLGENIGEDGKKLKAGLKGLLDGLRDTTPKTVEAFKKLGITTDDARKAEVQLLGAVLAGAKGIEDLPKPLREFLDEIIATEGAAKRLVDTQQNLAGDLTAQGAALQTQLDKIKNEPTWDKLMERFKAPLIAIADGIFTWIEKHQAGIISALEKLGSVVGFVADNFLSFMSMAMLPKLAAGLGAIIPITAQIAGVAAPIGGLATAAAAAFIGMGLLKKAIGETSEVLGRAAEMLKVKAYMERVADSEYLSEQARSIYDASVEAGKPMTAAELEAAVGEAAATRGAGSKPWVEPGYGADDAARRGQGWLDEPETPAPGHEMAHGGGGWMTGVLEALERSKQPIVTVVIAKDVDAGATVRTDATTPQTMTGPSGATP